MKRFTFLAIMIVAALSVSAQTIQKTYHFQQPLLQSSGEYTEVMYPECKSYSPEGQPLLPWLSAELLLPPGTEATSVVVTNIIFYDAIPGINIRPASKYFPISEPAGDDYVPLPDPEIYESNVQYPLDNITQPVTFLLAGHSISTLTICPLHYIPSANTITPIKDITIEIHYSTTSRTSDAISMRKNNPSVLERVQRIADNPEMLESYSYPSTRTTEADMLVITSSTFMPDLEEYISFKKSQGFIVISETTDDIYLNYPGQDEQEQIRNCIIDYYQNYEIRYVLLGGDADTKNPTENIVPTRGLSAYNDKNIPADMYYACLDGTWNDDGDNKWGEPGEDDLFAELAVGRISFDSQEEIQNITNKLILYQDSPVVEDIEKTLMLGEKLDNQPTWGGDSKDEVAYSSNTWGISTEGVSDNFEVTLLYDRDYIWNKNAIFDQFCNHGTHLLNHLGHSNVAYNMKMENSSITTSNFTNDGITRGFVIGYSQGCYNGSMDNRGTNTSSYSTADCFAEKITSIATAEVASIANSRYGWYSPGQTNGPSQYFDREFFDAIFGEGMTEIGFANGDSKEDNVGYISSDQIGRWCAYELNVFGDPSMDIWTAAPASISLAYSPAICMGATEFKIFTDVTGARIGLFQDGVLIGRGFTGDDGSLNLTLFNAVDSDSDIEISVIAHNRSRSQAIIEVIEDQPYIVYNSLVINDQSGNNNSIIDYGETIIVDVEMINIGDQPANNVICNLSTENEFLTVNDGQENYGTLGSGQTKVIQGAFSFTVDSLSPWHTALLHIESIMEEGSSMSSFLSTIHAPELRFEGFAIYDESGNDNGRLDPGETANLEISIINEGSSEAYNVAAELEALCEYISVQEGDVVYGNLTVGETGSNMFTVVASTECPDGTQAKFELLIEAQGGLSTTDSLDIFIGQPPVLVLDLDNNRNSGPVLYQTIVDLGVGAEYFNSMPSEMSKYDAVFVSLGTLWDNHVLTNGESDKLSAYLNEGGYKFNKVS